MKAIIVIPTQGFANRLRMIASSYILAEYMKLEHYINWEPFHDCNIEFDEIWERHPFKKISKDKIIQSKYLYFGHVHTLSIMEKILNPGNVVQYIVLTGGHEFKHPSMNNEEFLHRKYKFYSQLKFKQQIPVLPSTYGCVHIRTLTQKDAKDVVKNKRCNFPQNSPLEQFVHIIKKIDDDIPLFIISNDIAISSELQKQFPSKKILLSNPTSLNRDTSHGIHEAIKDFIILSQSSFIIGSYYSSFSDEASFFKIIPKIIPLSPELYTQNIYHCSNYSVSNKVGFLNFDNNTLIKYFKESLN